MPFDDSSLHNASLQVRVLIAAIACSVVFFRKRFPRKLTGGSRYHLAIHLNLVATVEGLIMLGF
jgi:hypothetical protein